jgi:hypothetical protein
MKVLKQIFLVFTLMYLALSLFSFAPSMAQSPDGTFLPLPDQQQYGDLPAPGKGSAQQQFYALVISVIQNARYLLGAVAVTLIVYAGLRMIVAQGNEDTYTTQRQNILYAIIGLALVGMAGEIVRIFQVSCDVVVPGQACTPGGFLKDPNAIIRQSTLFNQRTQLLMTFIKYTIGSIAVLEIVRSGMRMITMGDQEDKIEMDKKNLMYGILGLLLIIIADSAINNVFFKIDLTRYPGTGGAQASVDAVQGVKEIVGFTNVVVSIVSPLAILALIAAGVMYIASAGNEEKQTKAKRMIFVVVIGILIMYAAFAIVSTFIAGRFEGGSGQVTQPTNSTITTQ